MIPKHHFQKQSLFAPVVLLSVRFWREICSVALQHRGRVLYGRWHWQMVDFVKSQRKNTSNMFMLFGENKNSTRKRREAWCKAITNVSERAALHPLCTDPYVIVASFSLFWCCKFLFVEKWNNLSETFFSHAGVSVFLDMATWGRQIQKCSNPTHSGFKLCKSQHVCLVLCTWFWLEYSKYTVMNVVFFLYYLT